ncbi:MAG TPA: DUF2911 domain-containing protein [Gemmatimonadaceae bacterium]|nr:DUF2911 domain-containing protein [Gemmatimonadaceae bacterium]
MSPTALLRRLVPFAVTLAIPCVLRAQSGAIVYRLGGDTVAFETWTRSATRFAGEMVARNGPAVNRYTYELTLADGRVTAASVKRLQGDGSPFPGSPIETRFTFRDDSATRTLVWPDSTQVRAWAAPHAFPALPVFVYAPYALLASPRRDSVPAVPLAGNNVGYLGFEAMGGDTLRLRGAPYAMLVRYGRGGRLESVVGSYTTNKSVGTPAAGAVNVAAIARTMKPTGVLSPRVTAYAGFMQGPITINYGSPAVRGRTVWGGTLVPFDTIWRTGANEATHLATSKTLQLGEMTLAPGLYTLWIQHTRTATWLIVNRQVGQWGTGYNAANDIGRVAMQMSPTKEHVEDFTITIRALGGPRGAFEFAWGDQMATAPFTVRP